MVLQENLKKVVHLEEIEVVFKRNLNSSGRNKIDWSG
jgi:hypothetical protein